MKRKIFAAVSVALGFLVALGASACGLLNGTVTDDRFPYDAAKEEGFSGSESAWLAGSDTPSTRERRLYEELVAEGYDKSFFEFLKEFGISSDDTAYVNEALSSVVSVNALFDVPRTVSSTGRISSNGAGVIYSLNTATGDAYFITNYHVIYSAKSYGTEITPYISDEISVYLYGGEVSSRAIAVNYVGGSMQHDIAVLSAKNSTILKATQSNTVYAKEAALGDSDSVTVGETAYAIGNPDDKGISVTQGVVSVDAEYIRASLADGKRIVTFLEIRTDAAVNHGNSGGGLFNAQGELIGIVNARSEGSGVEAFGYAIPSNLAVRLAQNIIDNAGTGGALIAELGFDTKTEDSKGVYNDALGKYFTEEKVVVQNANSTQGLGFKNGVRSGDTLYSASIVRGGEVVFSATITRKYKFDNLLVALRKGDTLKITVIRASEQNPLELSIPLTNNSNFTLYN